MHTKELLVLFVVQFEDVYADHPERLPERERHMAAHLTFLAEHGDRVVKAYWSPPFTDCITAIGVG
jgi:hypothetical protein